MYEGVADSAQQMRVELEKTGGGIDGRCWVVVAGEMCECDVWSSGGGSLIASSAADGVCQSVRPSAVCERHPLSALRRDATRVGRSCTQATGSLTQHEQWIEC